jgi:signal transduction histidine kinase/DNA-binding NarL/FixJ family response regulator
MFGRSTNRGSEGTTARPGVRSLIRRWMRLSLTARMAMVVIIAVLPALAIQAINEYFLRRAGEDDIRQRVIQITKQFGEEMKEQREGASQLLVALGELDAVQNHLGEECNTIFTKLKSRFVGYARLGAADRSGKIFCSSDLSGNISVADMEFFKRAIKDDGLAVGNYFVEPRSQQKMLHFAERFRDADGEVAGVVFAALDLNWLSEHLKERGLTASQSILIADRLGNIIARLPHPEQVVGKNMRKSHEAIMDGDTAGWEEAKGVDGVTRIFGYVPVALPPEDFFLSAGQAKAEAFEPIDDATKRGVILILLGLLAAMYLAWFGGRKFIKQPIANLLDGTAAWGQGNYEARVTVDDPASEIGRLGLAFNDMADALAVRYAAQQRAEEELRHLNATLESRIERRTLELEEANRAKSQFLAKMSHEIRTPVNGVLGMLELLRQTRLDPKQQRYIGTAYRSAEALLGIIAGILDISKIEAGKIELEQATFDLRSVVDEVAETFADLAYGKGLGLDCSIPADLPTALIGDAGRLRQILTNLVGNAIKFTEHGEVRINAEAIEVDAASAFIAFTVTDTGIGIPPDKQQHIFEAFAQADSSTTRRFGGTGLGLSIANQLCEMMGGEIAVTSEPGHGSTFRFTARFGRQKAEENSAGAPQPSAPPAAGPQGIEGAPVLLVEDNPVNLEVAVGMLESFGCTVETAADGKEALERYAGGEFNLIFMDCQMPEMDGFKATAEIRKREAQSGRRVPIVALTASAIEGDREQCLAAGMDDYVAKPFTAEQMRAALATWLDRSTRQAGNGKRDHLSLAGSAPAKAPPPQPIADEPIDDRVLDELARLQRDGRPDIVGRVITLFLQSAAALVKDLEEAAAHGDTALLHRASHTLKSASANVGAVALSMHCKEVEALARNGLVPDAPSRIETIIEDYRRAQTALTARLPRVA